MTDSVIKDIKSGKGLSPISNNDNSSTKSGSTTEQRNKGISIEKYTLNEVGKKSDTKEDK